MSRDPLAGWPRLRRTAWRAMRGLARALPLDGGRLLATVVGRLVWACDARGRKVVADNLAPLQPAVCRDAANRAVQRSYIAAGLAVAEGLRLDRLPARQFKGEQFSLDDPWQVFAHRPLVGPAILVGIHANQEMLLAALHHLGLVHGIETAALDEVDPWLTAERTRLRAAVGCRAVTMDRAPLAALRALRERRVLALAADRDYSGRGLVAEVRGREMRLPPGPAALAAQTGAMIVPLLLARQGWRRFRLVVGRPLRPQPGADPVDEVSRLTTEMAAVIGRFLVAAPAQWVAFHPVWAR